jgi:hypothetical protein
MLSREGAEAVQQAVEASEEPQIPDPDPLIAPDEEPRLYPTDALSPTMRNAVGAYHHFGQQPVPLIALSAMSVAALATQALVNVGRDRNLIGPISLNLAVIAESGERKTSADTRMKRSARRWQQDYRDRHVADVAEADSRIAVWQAQRDGILAKIKSASGAKPKGAGVGITDLRAALIDLDAHRPSKKVMPTLFFEDVTPEALAQEMAAGWPSAALWSDEGALVIGSHGMSDDTALRYFGLLNRFWDGNSFERFRATSSSFAVVGRRLTCSLMMQHIVLCRLIGAAGGVARGVGFLARFLLAWPCSTMGQRAYREGDLDGPALAKWDIRIRELLSKPLPADPKTMVLDPPTLALSDQARMHWIDFHDDAERELGRLGQFGDVADFAAKAAENSARIAAIMWVVENGPDGEIDAATMQAAAAIASWHLHEAKRIVGATNVPQAVSDAALLIEWMQKKSRWRISPRDVLHEGPSQLRNKMRRDAAAKILIETSHIFELTPPGGTVWTINPKLKAKGHGVGT